MRGIPHDIGTFHFIGIGGIGMSGIAEVLHELGYKVQGSDASASANVKRLQDKGIKVMIGHDAENLMNSDGQQVSVVVYSSAVKGTNPELKSARENRLPVVRRAEMLAELMRLKWGIAVAGTHGKTTTTSLVGAVLEQGGMDPTIINGGIINAYGSNTRLGKSEWMVVEADESDGSFNKLPATAAIVTNIDPEHLDHYGSYDEIKNAFYRFIDHLPFYGFAALCLDHPAVQGLVPQVEDKRIITYGFSPQADIRAINVKSNALGSSFDIVYAPWLNPDHEERVLKGVQLQMHGDHNIQNSLAATVVAHELQITDEQLKQAFASFSGVKRRFTRTGVVDGITIIDDYGHHPVEIKAVLKAARSAIETQDKGKIIAVVQPHRYSRLESLFEDFCTCLNDADQVIVADVYAAGEAPIDGIDKEHFAEGLRTHGHHHVGTLDSVDMLASMISDAAVSGDMVIHLGAGDITKWANELPEQLAAIRQTKQQSAS